MIFPWPTDEILAVYEETRHAGFIDHLFRSEPVSDTITFERQPAPRAAMENNTMDKQQKIREYLADIMRAQRNGKRSDRVNTVNLHRGRGSSLKKLNRIIRTQLGLRPETYISAENSAFIGRRWAQIQALNAA